MKCTEIFMHKQLSVITSRAPRDVPPPAGGDRRSRHLQQVRPQGPACACVCQNTRPDRDGGASNLERQFQTMDRILACSSLLRNAR